MGYRSNRTGLCVVCSCVAPPGSNTHYHRRREIATNNFKSPVKIELFSFAITFSFVHRTPRKKSRLVEKSEILWYYNYIYLLRGETMKVTYKKLWVLCAEREISKAELRKRAGLSSATFTKLRKNQEVNLSVLLKIATVMDCNAGEMMDFIKDDTPVESTEP